MSHSDKYIFLDRDGTIIHDVNYLKNISDIRFFDGTFRALKKFIDYDYKLVLITNQSGIGRGMFTRDQFHKVNNAIINQLKSVGITIERTLYCPHLPTDHCECRKPATGLFDQFTGDNDVNVNESWMIGDKETDVQFGLRCNLSTIYINANLESNLESNYKNTVSCISGTIDIICDDKN